MELPSDVKRLCESQYWFVTPTGSNYICPDNPSNDDEDFLIQVYDSEESVRFALSALTELGYDFHSSIHYQELANEFISFKKDKVNLIVTRSHSFADKWRAATNICKVLNVTEKDMRIKLFRAALYNEVQ